jgi:hypothetical protein
MFIAGVLAWVSYPPSSKSVYLGLLKHPFAILQMHVQRARWP